MVPARFLAWAVLLSAATFVPAAALAPTGINLPRFDIAAPSYGGSWHSAATNIFTNLFKHSTPFECNSRGKGSTGAWGWGPGEAWVKRPDGYPAEIKQLASWNEYCVSAKVGGVGAAFYAAGKYVLLFDGTGKVTADGDAKMTSSAAGRLVLDITPASGFYVRILQTDLADPVRNIRIVAAAAEATHATTPFQPKFVEQVTGFQVLRFTMWQRIWGDARNPQMIRSSDARATPAVQTYQMKDGVALEDMVALANQVAADPFFSLPNAVDDADAYSNAMATVVAANLDPSRSVYIEYGQGGVGWMTTELPTMLLRLARIWRAAFTAAGANPARVIVVATYENPAWIPYFFNTFGANTDKVDAIGVVGGYGAVRSWNSNRPCYYDFAGNNFAANNAGIELGRVTSLARSAVIHADLLYNNWYQRLKASGKRLIALQGGPDSRNMVAAGYSMRDNYRSILGCKTYPCSRSLFPPFTPSSITFASEAERNATLAQIKPVADTEQRLDELLMQVKLREAATKDHMLDHLWRWNAMGGGKGDVLIAELTNPQSCPSSTAPFIPLECQPGSGVATTSSPETSPVYQALRAFQAEVKGGLPLSQDWSKLEASSCDPACQYGTCVKGRCSCWAGYSGSSCSSKTSRPNQCNTLVGVNLEGVRDWSRTWTWVDVMKSGRGWLAQNMDGSGGWGNFTGVSVDAGGVVTKLAPNQLAGTMMIRDLEAHIPAGTYTILYDGDGVIDCSMDVDVMRQIEAGRIEVDLKPSTQGNNGLYCMLQRTNPDNPVRNIRVLMPGFDAQTAAAIPFHPRFLSYISKFGVLRFMGWMETNTVNLPRTWAQRAKPSDRSYAGINLGGVPIEHMVLLSNLVGAAPWFSMPHLADDDYHRNFASYVLTNLRPDVKVFVEWSNEVWHTGFPAGQFAQAEGVRLGMNEEGAKWGGGATNEARLCYYSERTKNMSIIWKDVFGAQKDRVVIVAQGQAVWPLTSDKVLSCRGATPYIDALAVAGYFGDASKATDLATFMSTTLPAQVDASIKSNVAPHAAIAAKYNKPLITYESGPGIGGAKDFVIQANRHPDMYGAFLRNLNGLVAAGVSLITHFDSLGAFSQFGCFGLSEWMDQDQKTAPKLQAIQAFIAENASTCAPPPPGGDGSGGNDGNVTIPGPPTSNCLNACSGNGECLGGACYCNTGFSGADCSSSSPTAVFECGYQCTFGQGVCKPSRLEGSTQYYGCTCNPGFYGISCSLFSCPQNCSFSGTCLDSNLCACWPGFKGNACEIDCGCNGHGTCDPSSSQCLCDVGWKLGAAGCEPECLGCEGGVCTAPGECSCAAGCRWGTCFNGACECFAGYSGAACDVLTPQAKSNFKSPVGIEVAAPSYWSPEWIWLDAMSQSSAWFTTALPDWQATPAAFDTQQPLTLGPTGYPTSLPQGLMAHKLILRNVRLHSMPGRWVALYDGEGTVDFGFDAKVASVGKGRIEFDYLPTANLPCQDTGAAYCGDNGIWLKLMATNPANPVRNIRLIPPGFEGSSERQVFHPWYVKSLERYSVLRFMGWLGTNTDALPAWDQRTTPAHDTQARAGGVALEHIVGLCNRLGASPWINVHHLADDAYVRKLALFLKEKLRPDVKIWVEHSNEVWNQGFAQGKFARAKGLQLGLSTKDDLAGYLYHGKRSAEIFDIFTEVFGAEARASRLSFVVGTWGFVCSGTWGVGCGVIAMNTTLSYGTVAAKADAVAVTGYFDCGLGSNPTLEAQTSVDALLAQCLSETQKNKTRGMITTMQNLAQAFNLPLTTYEAGPSIVEGSVIFNGGGTAGAADKYIALQRDQRFQGVYEEYLSMFDSLGLVNESRPWMHFTSTGTPSKYGFFALQEYTGQSPAETPKYRALMGLLDKKPPPVYAGCLDPSFAGARGLGEGSFFGVPAVLFPRKGGVLVQGVTYNITFPASHAPTSAVTLALFKGTDCGSAAPLASAGPLTPQTLGGEAFVPFTVPSGLDGSGFFLRVQGAAGPGNFSELFAIQPLQIQGAAGCVINPLLPPVQPLSRPVQHCNPEYKWNVTTLPTGICEVQANGCRYYRTSGKAGAWTSVFKPVYDCSAQFSASASWAALVAAGSPAGLLKPGQPCA